MHKLIIKNGKKMITKTEYTKALSIVQEYHEQKKEELNNIETTLEELGLHSTSEDRLIDVLTWREAGVLKKANDWRLGRMGDDVFVTDIKAVNLGPVWYYRNVGKKTIQGIKDKLSKLGVEIFDIKANTYQKTQEIPVVIFKNPICIKNKI